jgi:hypothetical protein
MQELKPGEAIIDELANPPGKVITLEEMADGLKQFFVDTDIDDPYEHMPPLDALAARLGAGQAPLRSKQGVFQPRRMALFVAAAWRYAPPPGLCVQFDYLGRKTTFPVYA